MENPVLRAAHLSVAFQKPGQPMLQAVKDISLSVMEGEAVCLVGPSGCGKSVTSQALMGLLPPDGVVTGGQIIWNGQDMTHASERNFRTIRGSVASMLFQEPAASLDPVRTLGWQMDEVLNMRTSLTKEQRRQRAIRLFDEVGLPAPERQCRAYPHQLSGGMCQRAMIAIALAAEPKLLLADEPTTGLDTTIQLQILELLRREQRQRGMALLLITHDMGVVARMADRVIVMSEGRDVEQGEVRTLFSAPRHPVTKALLQAAREAVGPLGQKGGEAG